ncbi:MAG TPA: ClpX C4-type zinc finger protein [Polyangiaceae bacterium]|jgi:hypothetical protein|nr:ClpX C4-type zinc finger protein [Polyangiaceae bacterium]
MSPEPSLDACSFCLATRQQANYLVAAPLVAICDACVRGARPPGFWLRLRRRLTGGPRREAAPTAPYRDAVGPTCSFCRRVPGTALRGAKACICAECVALAADVLAEGAVG